MDARNYSIFEQYSGGHPLLDRLRFLTIVLHRSQVLSIVSPNLSQLAIKAWGEGQVETMDAIRCRWPGLKSLHLPRHHAVAASSAASLAEQRVRLHPDLRAACRCRKFQPPRISALSPRDKFWHRSKFALCHVIPFRSIPEFDHTHRLCYLTTPPSLDSGAHQIKQAPLQSLTMRAFEVTISAAVFNDLIKILHDNQARRSLLTLTLLNKRTPWHDVEMFGTRAFNYLASFNQLRWIEINFHDLLSLLDDDMIEQMAQGWPHAIDIALTCTSLTLQNAAKVTFKGLASIIELCPRLNTLSVPFTAVNPDSRLLERIR